MTNILLGTVVAFLLTHLNAWTSRCFHRNSIGLRRNFIYAPPLDTSTNTRRTLATTSLEASKPTTKRVASPGNPVLKSVNEDTNVASITIAIPASATQTAFDQACEIFNEEVKTKQYKVAGFRPGSKLPPQYLFQIFGEKEMKNFCGTLVSEAILVRTCV